MKPTEPWHEEGKLLVICHVIPKSHHVNPHQSTPPHIDVTSTNSQHPPGQHHPYPIFQVAIHRLNVTKPTVSTTNHLPATTGATNPTNTHHHITTHTSEDPPNDETGGKAPTLSSFQFQLSGEGVPPRSVIPILMQRGGWIPPHFIFVSISMQRRGYAPPCCVVNPWLSNPRKVAQQCRLTLALPLQGLFIISGGKPLRGLGYPRVFINPLPVPTKTRAHRCGCGFWWVRAQVTLENPRVACDIPYTSHLYLWYILKSHKYLFTNNKNNLLQLCQRV